MIVRLSNRNAVYMPCVGMASDSIKQDPSACDDGIYSRSFRVRFKNFSHVEAGGTRHHTQHQGHVLKVLQH